MTPLRKIVLFLFLGFTSFVLWAANYNANMVIDSIAISGRDSGTARWKGSITDYPNKPQPYVEEAAFPLTAAMQPSFDRLWERDNEYDVEGGNWIFYFHRKESFASYKRYQPYYFRMYEFNSNTVGPSQVLYFTPAPIFYPIVDSLSGAEGSTSQYFVDLVWQGDTLSALGAGVGDLEYRVEAYMEDGTPVILREGNTTGDRIDNQWFTDYTTTGERLTKRFYLDSQAINRVNGEVVAFKIYERSENYPSEHSDPAEQNCFFLLTLPDSIYYVDYQMQPTQEMFVIWNQSTGIVPAATYEIYMSTNRDDVLDQESGTFTEPPNENFRVAQGVTDTTAYLPASAFLPDTDYFLRVIGVDAVGKFSVNDVIITVHYDPAIDFAPTLNPLPEYGKSYQLPLSWSDESADGATEYRVEMSTAQDFATIYRTEPWVNGTSYNVSFAPEELYQTFYYRVIARDRFHSPRELPANPAYYSNVEQSIQVRDYSEAQEFIAVPQPDGRIYVHWEKPLDNGLATPEASIAGVQKYAIYRNGSLYYEVLNPETTYFVDDAATLENEYNYRIAVIDTIDYNYFERDNIYASSSALSSTSVTFLPLLQVEPQFTIGTQNMLSWEYYQSGALNYRSYLGRIKIYYDTHPFDKNNAAYATDWMEVAPFVFPNTDYAQIQNLIDGEKYYYRVTAEDAFGNWEADDAFYYSDMISSIQDASSPYPVVWDSIHYRSENGDVTLTWQAVSDSIFGNTCTGSGVKRYHVYRSYQDDNFSADERIAIIPFVQGQERYSFMDNIANFDIDEEDNFYYMYIPEDNVGNMNSLSDASNYVSSLQVMLPKPEPLGLFPTVNNYSGRDSIRVEWKIRAGSQSEQGRLYFLAEADTTLNFSPDHVTYLKSGWFSSREEAHFYVADRDTTYFVNGFPVHIVTGDTIYFYTFHLANENVPEVDGRTYHFHVKARRVSNTGGGPQTAFCDPMMVTIDLSAPEPVRTLRAKSYKDGEIRLTWQISTDAGSGLAGYYLYRSLTPPPDIYIGNEEFFELDNSFYVTTLSAATTTYSEQPPTIEDGNVYYYTLLPFDTVGQLRTDDYPRAVFTVCDATPPVSPELVALPEFSPGDTILIEWNAVEELATYNLEWSTDEDFYWALESGWQSETSFVVKELPSKGTTHLPQGVSIYYRVLTQDSLFNVNPTPSATETSIQDYSPPTPVTRLTSVAQANGDILLSWDEASVDGLSGMSHYRVVRRNMTLNGDFIILNDHVSASAFEVIDDFTVDGDPTDPNDPMLVRGMIYEYKVLSVDRAGNVQQVGDNTIAGCLHAPVAPILQINNYAEYLGHTLEPYIDPQAQEIEFEWTSVSYSGGLGYLLIKRDFATDAILDTINAGSSTTYNLAIRNSDLEQKYKFEVVARDTNNNVSISEASLWVPAAIDKTPPTAVTTLDAESFGDRIVLNWSPSTDARLFAYLVMRDTVPLNADTELNWGDTEFLVHAPATTLEDNHQFHQGVTYYYHITAVDSSGNERSSDAEASALCDTIPPVAPMMTTEYDYQHFIQGNSIGLDWNAVQDPIGGVIDDDIHYQLQISLGDPAFNFPEVIDPIEETEIQLNELDDNQNNAYYFRVRAVDHFGNASSWSNVIDARFDGIPPTAVPNVSTTLYATTTVHPTTGDTLQAGSIRITWHPVNDNQSGCGLSHYAIYRSRHDINNNVIETIFVDSVASNVTSWIDAYHDNGLAWSQRYTYKVLAYDFVQNVDVQNAVSSWPPRESKPPVPFNVTAAWDLQPFVLNQSTYISWSYSHKDLGEDVLFTLEEDISPDFDSPNLRRIENIPDTTWLVSIPEEQQAYYYRVKAVDITYPSGASHVSETGYSRDMTMVVYDGTTPPAIRDIQVQALPDGEIRLNWGEPYDISGITQYYIYRRELGSDFADSVATTTDTSFVDGLAYGLENDKVYQYGVQSVDGVGHRQMFWEYSDFVYCDAEAPAKLSLTMGWDYEPYNNADPVEIHWENNPADSVAGEVDENTVYVWEVHAGAPSGPVVQTATISTRRDTVYGLQHNAIYYLTVYGIDGVGNIGEKADPQQTIIDGLPPQKVDVLGAESIINADGDIRLTWDGISDNNESGVAGYYLYRAEVNSPDYDSLAYVAADTADSYVYIDNYDTESSLEWGRSYWYQVRPMDNVGNLRTDNRNSNSVLCGPWGNLRLVLDNPVDYQSGSVLYLASDSTEFHWSALQGLQTGFSYIIQRDTVHFTSANYQPSSAYESVPTYDETEYVWIDTDLDNDGVTYYYQVAILAPSGVQVASSNVMTICYDRTAPTAVEDVAAISYPNGKIKISWSPSTDVATPIRHYQVYRKRYYSPASQDSLGTLIATLPGTQRQLEDYPLPASSAANPHHRYVYTVFAQDMVGRLSNYAENDESVSIPAIADHLIPINPGDFGLTASIYHQGSWWTNQPEITFDWRAPANAQEIDASLLKYYLLRSINDSTFVGATNAYLPEAPQTQLGILDQTGISETAYVDSIDLTGVRTYYYKLQSRDQVGNMNELNEILSVKTDVESPTRLNFVRAEVKAGGAVKLSWAVAYDGEGNPIGSTDNEEGIGLKKYQVLRKKVGTDIWRVVADSVAPNTLTYTDNQNLQWGSAYIYKVNVYDFLNNVQENSPLRQVFVDARNELVLDELNEFTASPQTTLRWHWQTAMPVNDYDFRVIRFFLNGEVSQEVELSANDFDYTFSLPEDAPETHFRYQVIAYRGGVGDSSNVVETINDFRPPQTPIFSRVISQADGKVYLQWNAVTDAESGLQHYKVIRCREAEFDSTAIEQTWMVADTFFTDVPPATTTRSISYRIQALDQVNLASYDHSNLLNYAENVRVDAILPDTTATFNAEYEYAFSAEQGFVKFPDVSLTWTEVTEDLQDQEEVVQYYIVRSIGDDDFYNPDTISIGGNVVNYHNGNDNPNGIPGTQIRLENLRDGIRYFYKIVTRDLPGNLNYNQQVLEVIPDLSAPFAVPEVFAENLPGTEDSTAVIRVYWNETEDTGANGSGVHHYRIYRRLYAEANPLDLNTYTFLAVSDSLAYHDEVPFSQANSYQYIITPVDNVGHENRRPIAATHITSQFGHITLAAEYNEPTGNFVKGLSPLLNWNFHLDDNADVELDEVYFVVHRDTVSPLVNANWNGGFAYEVGNELEEEFSAVGAQSGTLYYYWVQAFNNYDGLLANSNVVYVILDATPPNMVEEVAVSYDPTDKRYLVSIEGDEPRDPNNGSGVSYFRLNRYKITNPMTLSRNGIGTFLDTLQYNETYFDTTALEEGAQYLYLISTVDRVGNVSPQKASAAVYYDTKNPARVTNLEAEIDFDTLGVDYVRGDSIHLMWDASWDNYDYSPGSGIKHYRVYYSQNPVIDLATTAYQTTTETEIRLDNLSAVGKYHYSIVVEDRKGNLSAFSDTLMVRQDGLSPNLSNLNFHEVTVVESTPESKTYLLGFNEVPDRPLAPAGSGIHHYEVWRQLFETLPTADNYQMIHRFTPSQLNQSADLYETLSRQMSAVYFVRVVDNVGNVGQSDVLYLNYEPNSVARIYVDTTFNENHFVFTHPTGTVYALKGDSARICWTPPIEDEPYEYILRWESETQSDSLTLTDTCYVLRNLPEEEIRVGVALVSENEPFYRYVVILPDQTAPTPLSAEDVLINSVADDSLIAVQSNQKVDIRLRFVLHEGQDLTGIQQINLYRITAGGNQMLQTLVAPQLETTLRYVDQSPQLYEDAYQYKVDVVDYVGNVQSENNEYGLDATAVPAAIDNFVAASYEVDSPFGTQYYVAFDFEAYHSGLSGYEQSIFAYKVALPDYGNAQDFQSHYTAYPRNNLLPGVVEIRTNKLYQVGQTVLARAKAIQSETACQAPWSPIETFTLTRNDLLQVPAMTRLLQHVQSQHLPQGFEAMRVVFTDFATARKTASSWSAKNEIVLPMVAEGRYYVELELLQDGQIYRATFYQQVIIDQTAPQFAGTIELAKTDAAYTLHWANACDNVATAEQMRYRVEQQEPNGSWKTLAETQKNEFTLPPSSVVNACYVLRICAMDPAGNETVGETFSFRMAPVVILPQETALYQNAPNPFNPETEIAFAVAEAAQTASLQIYNIKGQLVRSWKFNDLAAGRHQVQWNGTNQTGDSVASGVYFYRLQVDQNKVFTRKMMLLK